jgi:PEP-CTERM motif
MRAKVLIPVAGVMLFGLVGGIGAPATAGLVGATVDTVTYLNVAYPPPGPTSVPAPGPTPDCTTIHYCNIPNYPLPSPPNPPGLSQNFPLPVVPVDYLEDSLTLTTISVGDTQITITNDAAGLFCYFPTGCIPDAFSGYGFFFSSGVDITDVKVDSGSSSDFQPVLPGGLSWTATSITVNVNGDNLAVGDELILDVTTAGGGPPPVPEPATWAMVLLGFAGLGLVGYRRRGGSGGAAHAG